MIKKILSILVVLTSFFGFGQIGWENKIIIDTAGKISPQFVTSANVNSDGLMDIIVGSGNGLCWFKNLDGQGNFSNSITIDSKSDAFDIFVEDMDGDGFKDLVYCKSNGNSKNVVWLKNTDGAGNFALPVVLATSNFYTKVQAIDMDNDGDFDIVYSSSTSLLLLKNNGTGTFTSQSLASSADAFFMIDVNGDQLVDLIYKSGYLLHYLQQNPDGTFLFKETMDSFVVNNYNNGFITGGDIDGDGDIDIAVIHENGNDRRIKWYKNTNNVFANFLTLTLLPSSNGATSGDNRRMILDDVNNDGLLDVVMHNSFLNKISWFINLGITGFGTEQTISLAVTNPRSIATGDFNNDAKLDVVAVGATNNDVIWFNNTTGLGTTFVANQLSQFVIFPSKIVVGDLNGDGTKDVLVTSTNDNKLSWYPNTSGLGDFSQPQKIITSTLSNAQNGLIADLNNDGKNDVVALSNLYEAADIKKIVQYLNSDSGNFAAEQVIYSSLIYIGKMETIDVDNDGDLDLVCSFDSGDIKVFKNNGNATYAAPTSFADSAGYFVPTDVDNDGDLDLIVSTTTSFFWLENTNGLGNYSVKHPVAMNLALPRKFVVGDINNDGLKEVIYANNNLGRITINANGTFGPQSTFSSLGNSNLIDMADLDNDGDLDIVCSVATNNNTPGYTLARFRYYLNDGSGTFGLPTEIYFDNINDIPYYNGYSSLAIDDLDGDGKKDLLLSISYYTKVMWFKNKGAFSNQISGTVRLDVANNGCTSGSHPVQQILVTTSESNSSLSTFTQPNGSYLFKVGEGAYTTNVTTLVPNYPASPAFFSDALSGMNTSITNDFCLQPIQLFDDLEVSFYPLNNARPGFMAKYVLIVTNKGTNLVNSSVALSYNNSKLQFLSATEALLSQTPNTLHFSIANLQPFGQFQTTVEFQVNPLPIVVLGEVINFSATSILAADITPSNNLYSYNQTIVGSYDPNDIQVLEGDAVAISNSGNYLHYIIRFQNTGNYYAERVVITAAIDEKLQWETMELESFSHSQRTAITNGNLITFVFDAIYLPGQTQDDAGSNGYIAFKIKPKNTVNVGDVVLESASIYFDFNSAIVTNQVATEYVEFLHTPTFDTESILAYPNPVKQMLYFSGNEKNVNAEVYNSLGQMVLQVERASSIDFGAMPTGMYLVKVVTGTKKMRVIRVLKE
jgi:hypothetical protein